MKKGFIYLMSTMVLLTPVSYAVEYTGVMEKVQKTNTLTVGYRKSSIPLSYAATTGKPMGYTIDLCSHIIADMKKELNKPNAKIVFHEVSLENRIPSVVNGVVDFECGASINTEERKKQVAFSYDYYVSGIKILTKTHSGIKGIKDLNHKKIAISTGTTTDERIKTYLQAHGLQAQLIYAKDHDQSFALLRSGEADAFIMNDVVLAGLRANAKDPLKYVIVDPALWTEAYAIMLPKEDHELKALVDNTLSRMMKEGIAASIYQKWFMENIPPKNANLQLPLNQKTKDIWSHPTDKEIPF